MEITIQKGSRIRAEWLEAQPLVTAALAGMQLKTTAITRSITGTIRHIRSSTPDFNIENVMLFVEPDDGVFVFTKSNNTLELCEKCGVKELQIKPVWIVEVIQL